MEGGINRQQRLPHKIEKKPGGENSQETLQCPKHSDECPPLCERRSDQFLQASRADDAVMMLGDAFAAIEMAALGTARSRFTQRMIEATLVDQV